MTTVDHDITVALFEAVRQMKSTLDVTVAQWPNLALDPPNSDKYLEIKLFPNPTTGPTWGQEKVITGILQIGLHWPADADIVDASEIAGQIAEYFGKGKIFYSGVAVVKIEAPPWVMSVVQYGQSVIMPVSIPYRCAT